MSADVLATQGHDYMACMVYMDPDVRCPQKGS